MIDYRPFRNSDPPALVELWRNQPPLRALLQPMSLDVLERLVLAKPYFDRLGMVLAFDEGRPVGFVHAAFGPDSDGRRIAHACGIISMVMVAPHPRRDEIARELLARGEDYLRERGTITIHGGGHNHLCPFYLGMYGGAALPGILASDQFLLDLFTSGGYAEVARRSILQLAMGGFRPVVDRQQMQVRRSHQILAELDPPAGSWWEACTVGLCDRARYTMVPRAGGDSRGLVTFWNMEPMAASWGVNAMGIQEMLLEGEEEDAAAAEDAALFLLGESLRQMKGHGVSLVEVQIAQENTARIRWFERLGFERIEEGVVLIKEQDVR